MTLILLFMGEVQSDNSIWRDAAKAIKESTISKSYTKSGLQFNFGSLLILVSITTP